MIFFGRGRGGGVWGGGGGGGGLQSFYLKVTSFFVGSFGEGSPEKRGRHY